jgi:hypothetical protein
VFLLIVILLCFIVLLRLTYYDMLTLDICRPTGLRKQTDDDFLTGETGCSVGDSSVVLEEQHISIGRCAMGHGITLES